MSRTRRTLKLASFAFVLMLLVISFALLYLCNMQAQNLAYPISAAARYTPTNFGISNWQDVSFQTDDGITLNGWYVPPINAHGGAVLFVHGIGGNREFFAREAQVLYANGYGMLLFDLRDCGTSGGDVASMGYWEALDVLAAYAYLAAKPEVTNIAVIGESMGGATAIRALTQIPDAAALIVESSYASVVDVVGDGVRARTGLPPFPFAQIILWPTGRESGADLFDVDSERDLAQIHVPVLIMHGSADETIPVNHAERLFAAANEPKQLWIVEGGGHGGLIYADPAGYAAQVLPFLAQALGGA